MKRRLLYGVLLVALLFAPVETVNISHLHPVQAVSVSHQWGQVVIETDTEDKGIGATTELALQNLKDTTGGILYLDTAEYLLFTEDAQDVVQALREVLKDNVRLCKIVSPVNPKMAVDYLRTSKDLPRLSKWEMGDQLPVLDVFEACLIFLKKVVNSA